jgi:RNA 3'-terminal phosphate cyclase (ATP)
VRPGFHPAGGGLLRVRVTPPAQALALELLERGALRRRASTIGLALLPESIAEREWAVLASELELTPAEHRRASFTDSASPGNFLALELEFEHANAVLTALGARGVPGERLARDLALEARAFLASDVPVGEHLADQLMLPLALLAGGRYRTGEPSPHTRTNAEIVNLFLPGAVRLEPRDAGDWLVTVAGRVSR